MASIIHHYCPPNYHLVITFIIDKVINIIELKQEANFSTPDPVKPPAARSPSEKRKL